MLRHSHIVAMIACLMMADGVAWACKPPDPVTGFAVQSVAHTTLSVVFDAPARGKVAVRLSPIPAGWGAATEFPCDASPCIVDGLDPDTTYEVRANPFVVTKTQGTIYGSPTEPVFLTTIKIVTLKDALHDGVETCLSRKLAHTACFKALNEALGKVTQ